MIKLVHIKQPGTIAMKTLDAVHNDIAAYPEIHSIRLNTAFTFVSSNMHDQRVSVLLQ